MCCVELPLKEKLIKFSRGNRTSSEDSRDKIETLKQEVCSLRVGQTFNSDVSIVLEITSHLIVLYMLSFARGINYLEETGEITYACDRGDTVRSQSSRSVEVNEGNVCVIFLSR